MASIRVGEFKEENREKLGIRLSPPISQMGGNLIALGKVFRALRGLPVEKIYNHYLGPYMTLDEYEHWFH